MQKLTLPEKDFDLFRLQILNGSEWIEKKSDERSLDSYVAYSISKLFP